MFSLFLPPEDVPPKERKVRTFVDYFIRITFASLFSYHCFDFLFTSVWIHGYVWALNQHDDATLNQQGASAIHAHQLRACPILERVLLSIGTVLLTALVLLAAGFRHRSRSVWYLLRLSALLGFVASAVRCMQMKQKLYPALHEGFYAYFMTFFIGLILSVRLDERFPKTAAKATGESGTAEVGKKSAAEGH